MTQLDMEKEWLFSKDQVEKSSASRRDNISLSEENRKRARVIWFIKLLAEVLDVKPYISSIASIYFHRFFLFHSFKCHEPFLVAAACLFLACKCEDQFKRIERIISATKYIQMMGPDLKSEKQYRKELLEDFAKFHEGRMKVSAGDITMTADREECLSNERELMKTLRFEVFVPHPQFAVADHLKKMKSAKYCVLSPHELIVVP